MGKTKKEDTRFIGVQAYLRKELIKAYPNAKRKETPDNLVIIDIETDDDMNKVDKKLVSMVPLARQGDNVVVYINKGHDYYSRALGFTQDKECLVVTNIEELATALGVTGG